MAGNRHPSFTLRFEPEGEGWQVTVVPGDVRFVGRALTEAEKMAVEHLARLGWDRADCTSDFTAVMAPNLVQAIDWARQARAEADDADLRAVRSSYRAIQALESAGFSRQDLSLLAGLAPAEVDRILRLGALEIAATTQIPTDLFSHEMEVPTWYEGSVWQTDGILSPGAALAWDMALDDLLADLAAYRESPHPAPLRETSLGQLLPDRFRARYDDQFLDRFVAVVTAVHARVISGDLGHWATPAEEIALVVLEQCAVSMAEVNFDVGVPIAKPSDRELVLELRPYVVDDTDVDVLWGPGLDGIEEDAQVMAAYGYEDQLRFDNWFKPYRGSGQE